MSRRCTLLAVAFCLFAAPAFCAPRTWKDDSGEFSLNAELVEVKDGTARLKKSDGKVVAIPVNRLSGADRQYLESRNKRDPSAADPAASKEVTELLAKIQQDSGVPALAGAIVNGRGLVAVGVTGVRKRGTEIPATLNDKWHLGSDTKVMTATLIARLVEQGQLKWDSTLGELLSESDAKIHDDLKKVTVRQLLSHRSGLPANLKLVDYQGMSGPKERKRVLLEELAGPPKPGSEFEYSNLGYIVAGAITEKLTGKTWEKSIVEQVFDPLKMDSVGFGGTGTPGQLDQPWSHNADGTPGPKNGPAIDNPPVMGPAGRVHCKIQDWAKFVSDQLNGLRDRPALLSNDSYKTLSSPAFGGDYALGWIVTTRPWGGGTVLTHSGSNTMNFATVWVAPQRDFAVLICINQGGDKAAAAADAAAGALIGLQAQKSGN